MRLALWSLSLAALLAVSSGAAGVAVAAEAPRLELDRGVLVVSGLPGVLSRPEVRPQLSSGLTTTFVVRVSAADEHGAKATGGGTVAVRFEPWDEVFLAAAAGLEGGARRDSLPSFDRLTAWWRELKLPALPVAGLSPGGSWQVKVAVHVVPFSESEREDTQRWFSASVGGAQRNNAEDLSASARKSPGSGILDLLVATSIQRRSLVSYDWTLTFRPSRGPEPRP
jgi:hypothetical protein